MNKSTTMTVVLVLLMLAMPGSIATIGALDQSAVAPGADENLQGEIVDTTEEVMVERVDPTSLSSILNKVQLPELGTPVMGSDWTSNLPIEGANDPFMEKAREQGFQLARPPVNFMESDATRGTDDEDNDDPWNGSKLASSDSVTGTLDMRATDPQGTLGDYIDWYKMEFKGLDPTVPGVSRNVTFTLTEFDSADITLYERTDDGTQYTTDYLDIMEVYVLYFDPFWGMNWLGGKKFYYDDGDDTDGWVFDGGSTNPDWQDNWTANFETAGDDSTGTEDTNGGTGGLTERGWYYIGISFNGLTIQGAAERPDFVIDYSFEVSSAADTNNFPNSPSTTAGAPNDFNNATAVRPTMPGRTHSMLNLYDWYRFDGVNQDYIWNMTVWVNVTRTGWAGDELSLNDNHLYIMLLWWGPGEDGKYDTDDDIWTLTYKILYQYIYYVENQGDTEPAWFMQQRFTNQGQTNNMQVNVFNVNNRTDATAGHPYLNGDARQMFIGLYNDPMRLYQTSTGSIQYYPSFYCLDQYNIQWSVSEIRPNTAPVVSDIKVTAEHPNEVYIDDPTGGYYETEFTIEATYTDENGDLPQKMYVIFDGKDNKPIEIQDLESNSLDKDVTDGKQYKMTITGEVLTDFPYPHSIKVFAYDTPGNKYHRSERSNIIFDNTSLKVWDDNPVKLVKTWPGLPVLSEDSQPEYIPLEGIDGAFDDPEKSFRGFNIWNPDIKGWVYDYEVMNPDDPANVLVSVNVSKADGFWQAKLTLGPNEHYSEGVPLLFRGYDDHSQINRSSRLIINPVNDAPKVLSVKVGSIDYDADNTNPLLPVVHLDTELTFKEDQLITFSIIAEDQDKESERTPLEYSYEPNPSSPWEGNPLPQVDMTTGVVTYTPTNGDVNKPIPNNKMVFTVDDRGADGDIKLTVYLKVDNVNDAPVLTIPAGTRSFQQFTTLAVKPQASDEDRGDTLKFEVNFEEQIGDTPSVLDQLPFVAPQKTLDWDLNENTGEFWFKLSDQNIWKTSTGNQKTTSITLAFKVTDKAGLSDVKTVSFDLQDVNEEPPAPKKVTSSPADRQEVNKAVTFTVEEVVDPDGDKLYYKWNFGDGFTGEGVNVTHVYTLQGIKTVEVWVEDGQFQTDKYTYRIEIIKSDVIDPDDDPPVDDDDDDTQSEFPLALVIGGFVVVLFLIVFIIIALLLLRKKPAPPAQQYPYDPALMGYNYQGLPPGAPGQLPPAQPPELPPAPEYVGTETQPAIPQQPPIMQTQQAAQPQSGPEQMGNVCPSCNAPVDPSWFLCPNCKAPLQ